jgi:hypothetical protein
MAYQALSVSVSTNGRFLRRWLDGEVESVPDTRLVICGSR